MNFNQWLKTFIEEKGLNTEHVFEFTINDTWNYMPFAVVIEYLENLDRQTKRTVKTKLVYIDFKNGNVMHFFEYCAKGIAQEYNGVLAGAAD